MTVISNIKHILVIAMTAVVAITEGSCTVDHEIDNTDAMPRGPVLRLSTGSSFSRAIGDDYDGSSDAYAEQNEENISRIDLFFFNNDKDTDAPFYVYEFTNRRDITTAQLTVKVPVEMIDNFKNNENKAYVYALVNLPEAIKVDENSKSVGGKSATLQNLQQVWVEAPEFATSTGVPSMFVMRGSSEVEMVSMEGRLAFVEGSILLERLASKIRLWASIPNMIYVDPETGLSITRDDFNDDAAYNAAIAKAEKWQPVFTETGKDNQPENAVKLYLYNIATRGRIDAYIGVGDDHPDLKYRNIDRSEACEQIVRRMVTGNELQLPAADVSEQYPYSHSVAYYSYPSAWDSSTPSEQHQTYVVLAMPWKNVTDSSVGSEWEMYYYEIPVNALRENNKDNADRLEPNRYYRIKIHLGMLGSKDLGSPQEIDASYEVVPWRSADVDVSIKDRRYLVVNQTEWTMNNVSTIQIPISSSHDIVVDTCFVNYFRYNDIWGDSEYSTVHNSGEFQAWKNALNGRNEAYITTSYGSLYAKKRYFADVYYVGREHPITFRINQIDRPSELSTKNNYGDNEEEAWDAYETKYEIPSVYTCTPDNGAGILIFTHPLVLWKYNESKGYYYPEMKDDHLRDEYSRCEIIIKIRHADWTANDDLYRETIHITQYPGMYVEEEHDYGLENSKRIGNWVSRTVYSPYVFANGNYGISGLATGENTLANFMHVYRITNHDGSNSNPNMYIIHTTQFTEDNNKLYEIGDPRTLYYNNLLVSYDSNGSRSENGTLADVKSNENNTPTRWTNRNASGTDTPFYVGIETAPRMYPDAEGSRNGVLAYYYPTDESKGVGSKENFIAPVFRIASSYGIVTVGSKEELRRRCASYQEAGRPAGRWRLPTKAELKYIAQLSAEGKIPILLGDTADKTKDGYYWTAQGGVTANGNGEVKDNTTGTPGYGRVVFAARCVYDDWYWIKEDGSPDVIEENDRFNPTEQENAYWGQVSTFTWGDKRKDNPQQSTTPKN